MSDEPKNILTWFGKRKVNVVTNGMQSHALSVHDCIEELCMALKAMQAGDKQEAMRCVDRLIVNEREADAQEDTLCEQLSLGELGPQEREDLLHFVRKTDSIANWSKESSLYVHMLAELGFEVPEKVWASLVGISIELESEVNYLLSCIKLFGVPKGDIEACIEGVKLQEHRIDLAYFDTMKQIYAEIDDPKGVMLALKVLESMEMAADTCKGCADTVSILMVARRLRECRLPSVTDGSGACSARRSHPSWRSRSASWPASAAMALWPWPAIPGRPANRSRGP